ncbi:5'-nucleotidase, lipoprotein e(P4) family [Thalassospira lucentensis]|uniref:5'-nucleotidase, lipoprotein e(P4) family n=1 Tax=Thalassospira lucentensis TaxID=168935 RepID=UPI00142DE3A6|nr:HAD family acid phosphatase [Thalassospira lucentensis]NIZ03205.1 acid phosphatase [Thalassospira lucentensis]
MTFIARSFGVAAIMATSALCAFGANAQEPAQNDGLNGTLWLQTSVEYKATAMSVYAGATRLLPAAIGDHSWTAALEQGGNYSAKPPAVILDVDETVLDNSAYQAWVVAENTHYSSKTWAAFVHDTVSTPTPGALEFTKAAAEKGVEVFYVSNRKAPEEESTIENLKKFGFPYADDKHVMLRGEVEEWGSNKTPRRQAVSDNYRVIMQFGDNLGDFTDEDGTLAERLDVMNKYNTYWGERWFMLPNPSYGSWEASAFGGDWGKSGGERRQDKINSMAPWAGPAE